MLSLQTITRRLFIAFLLLMASLTARAQRQDILINDNWSFRFSHQVNAKDVVRTDLPHTWNAGDALSGKPDYKRGIGNYERTLWVDSSWEGERLFLKFEGANSIADVFLNGIFVGEHRGGYEAFVFEITDRVKYGEDNRLAVRVSNAETLDVMPLVGDFNMYGGLYRPVHLIITDEVCIDLRDYASPGVRLVQEEVSRGNARVKALVELSNGAAGEREVTMNLKVMDGNSALEDITRSVSLTAGETRTEEIAFEIAEPHLWNGREDPFMYEVCVSLLQDGTEVDRVSQPLGLRFYRVDPEEGFFLNGELLSLHGVCRHQDRAEVGNALRPEHHEEDLALMLEMGVNAVRLAHYPQSSYIYDLMDRAGIVVWAEIPFVGPGGYADKGFVDNESFRTNGRQQLVEMIRQNYNHPSILFWGLFNELKEFGDNPVPYLRELNDLAHAEDPTRLTTSANNARGDLTTVTDVIGWNRYPGWYGRDPSDLAGLLDSYHTEYPGQMSAISEYGAGASIYHYDEDLVKPEPTGRWHPENWQTYYHIESWKIIKERPFVWASFVWNMFDFGAAHRTEGDRVGINDKGLVTFDRKTRKDAFYFYKANWNKDEPVLHIEGKRGRMRAKEEQTIMVMSNLPWVELFVNGESRGRVTPDENCIATWEGVRLEAGQNEIKAVYSPKKQPPIIDSFICIH